MNGLEIHYHKFLLPAINQRAEDSPFDPRIIKSMILAQQLNLQHEHSLSHKNSLPGSNPLIPLGPCALHIQSLSLLPCLSNPFFPVSPQEVIKQIAAFITFFS